MMIVRRTVSQMGLMKLLRPMGSTGLMGRLLLTLSFIIFHLSLSVAQIKIGGNVYGGGNQGEVKGSTKVTVLAGDIGAVLDPEAARPLENRKGKVFGGARMANVGGNTFVHIDGEHFTADTASIPDYIVINQVFGGNDIAGQIGTGTVPTELTAIKRVPADNDDPKKNAVDDTFNSFVRVSTKLSGEYYSAADTIAGASNPENSAYGKTTRDMKPADDAKKVYIGQLFAGSNGDYDYVQTAGPGVGQLTHSIYNRSDKNHTNPVAEIVTDAEGVGFQLPELDKTYMEVVGGSIVYAYGGGNNATVKEQTVIHVDNPSAVVNHLLVNADGVEAKEHATYTAYDTYLAGGHTIDESFVNDTKTYTNLLGTYRFTEMGINNTFSQPSSGAYQIGRFFGGNNVAEMTIRPTWNLLAGKIRNLYSGGNKGNMTSPEGLLLEIKNYSTLIVDNLYGGCRMGDVKPTVNGEYTPCVNLPGYYFPNELSARTLVRGGHINNVYGGNDVTGIVYGGNAIGIYKEVFGNVYGGGNGAYPYPDNQAMEDDDTYGDLYYGNRIEGGQPSYEALNAFRPNAEQVSIHLVGTDATHPTVIHGSIFVGGNCASLATKKKNPLVELKIGSHVIADKVYLGNNGEGMIDIDILKHYADGTFNTMSFTDPSVFAGYMEGVTMSLQPSIAFDNTNNGDPSTYLPYSSYVGSFFCGGNVGSMAIKGKETFTVNQGLNIYQKFVGGCNNANVPELFDESSNKLNAAYEGGILGSKDERGETSSTFYTDTGAEDGKIKDRLEINLENLTITPLRWDNTNSRLIWNTQMLGTVYTQVKAGTELTAGQTYYTSANGDGAFVATSEQSADASTFEKGEDYVPVENSVAHGYNAVANGTTLTEGETYYTSNTGAGEFISNGTEVSNGTNYYVRESGVRLLGGNIYGGCYNSGHVNGNIVFNINEDVLKRDEVFGDGEGPYGRRASGVDLLDQRDDLDAVALILFGGGYGEDTEVWGSTTVNHNKGYVFQICGGGERGVIGKKVDVVGEGGAITQEYKFNAAYSSTVNLQGTVTANSNEGAVEDLAETEYIYGGGKEGDVCGNTLVNLGNGRIYDAFAGACEANILGHSEAYIGRQPNGSGGYKDAFPWIQDIVYGGNDYCGTIYGEYEDGYDFEARLRDYATDKTQLHGYKAGEIPDVMKSSTYVEYLMGRVDTIFGGGYGFYDYTDEEMYGPDASMPVQHSSFVNIRPKDHSQNHIKSVFGGATGFPGIRENDNAQDRSYVLIDIPDGMTYFSDMEVFGSGSYNGLGMKYTYDSETGKTVDESGTAINLDEASAIIDLLRGRIHNVYGGSFNEGVTRKTVVNVPAESSIHLDNIFGGAYGTQILPPCDVYETQVNYKNTSEKAQVSGAIYGGNNNERRSLFTQVNISSPLWQNKAKGYTGTVYGAGRGIDTWSEHTEVNLLKGARLYQVYGGGEMGHVLNSASVQAYMKLYENDLSKQISEQDPFWNSGGKYTMVEGKRVPATDALKDRWKSDWHDAWTLGSYYTPGESNSETAETPFTKYATNPATSLAYFSNRAELDDKTAGQLNGEKKFNTNVIVNEGAVVEGYVYGGGLGDASVELSGDVYGSTYVAVIGGEVQRDVYAGGRAGGLDNLFGAESFSDPGNNFIASANVYIQGGTARNVYGGGYLGHVGHHTGDIRADYSGDRLAKANVVIGKAGTDTYTGGAPAITRNVYGAGEGGSVYGTSKITLNNGYIGYRYTDKKYVEELDDQKPGDLDLSGNIFGGGYVMNSYVDNTIINMYGGQVRGSLFGGGEVGPVGRGVLKTGLGRGMENGNTTIFRAGATEVNMYDGKVLRNVFGGGRGKDSWGGDGTLYMNKDTVASLKARGLECKGYVFGQTRVNIYGGEVGTDEGMAYGYGNVFGGGDEGLVYSAYMNGNELRIGKKSGKRYNKDVLPGDTENYNYQGYYYQYDKEDGFLTHNVGTELDPKYERYFTEDCKVLVEPHCQAYVDIAGTTYKAGDYVPTSFLNTLKDKNQSAAVWDNLDPDGIIIHNAVFAGGNIAEGSSSLFANATTVYGNATASIHDAYNRDLITIGTGHTGGLYGDGNLTFVDGYRELNITNYGTDYYYIKKNDKNNLSYDDYLLLPEREKAYYEVKYKCKKECTDEPGTRYSIGSNLPMDELLALFTLPNGNSVMSDTGDSILVTVAGKKEPNPDYWEQNGVVSVYAGRIMNTIQRADLCGVFGSRMVMKGAQDRVPETVDYTNYTINRVREVSLNKIDSEAGDTGEYASHGNYFGIYSVVNYLGALTSDVKFSDIRKTTNSDTEKYQSDIIVDETTYHYGDEGASFYNWKRAHINDKTRNNGTCHNQLALASGVYLEITSEESTGTSLYEKVWGPITGVVELDLINVQPGIGGGFVYAKNEHGDTILSGNKTTTLTILNEGAATQWDYRYETDDLKRKQWETSGNFIHSTQTIIDDCYNISNRYLSTNGVPAHYWYIAGSVYVYDQYISAYTGSPNAYSKTVELPITISAASHGTMTLMDVQPNLYAFYSSYVNDENNTPLYGNKKLVVNDVTYERNTPISYWDWNNLPQAQKKLFVADTYVVIDSCMIGDKVFPADSVLLKTQYEALDLVTDSVYHIGYQKKVAFTDVFRSSNNLSHDTGYLLTYNVTNPNLWNKWYTMKESDTREKNQTGGADYHDGPTYHPTTAGLYGQQDYSVNAIITKKAYDDYQSLSSKPASGQATFVAAYLVTSECTSAGQHYYPGAPVSSAIAGHTDPAYVSTATIQLSSTEYIYVNDLMTLDQKNKYKTDYASLASEIEDCVVPAYICTVEGLYGGSYYETGKNYRALEAYSAMSPTDREKFAFNYDALDLLIDPDYGGLMGKKYQYDSEAATYEAADANEAQYSLRTPINYTATYNSDTPLTLATGVTVTRGSTEMTGITEIQKNDELVSTVYESLPNERYHYAPIKVDAEGGTVYVVKESFVHSERPYAVGSTIDSETYGRLSDDEKTAYITVLTFTSDDVATDGAGNPLPLYYCREAYTIKASDYPGDHVNKGKVTSMKGVGEGTTYTTGDVPAGIVITAADYNKLIDKQLNFTIHGESPMETSTLYVGRNADINDLSTEKIITVVYKYDYEESDTEGTHITPLSERHVVNIHIVFKSGVPLVDDINPPSIVLPGTGITMRIPSVTPGAYEITGGGWELFEKEGDAESHTNGVEYTPNKDSLYWYQDGFYLAYYAKTYLGKTYSNHVPVSVANYHDLKAVMDDKKYHLHVDYDRTRLKRDSKIYINDYSVSSQNGLDLFKNLYDLSLINSGDAGVTDGVVTAEGRLNGHTLLNNSIEEVTMSDGSKLVRGVKGAKNLEFFLRTDIAYTDNPETSDWTPIGTDEQCFEGTLHGDGHTISGLDNSLFNNLCGEVYNLGVTGSFNTAGVVDKGTGYVESVWTNTSATTPLETKPYAVFGAPSDDKGYQVVNSYYLKDNNSLYVNDGGTTSGGVRGTARAMTSKEFYNGEVAYDLNNFYLYKRYNDHTTPGGSPLEYKYYKLGVTDPETGKLIPQTGRYVSNIAECSSGYNHLKYVEDRYADGDFIFAAGEIPNVEDERHWVDTEHDNKSYYFPIWPDDYFFFGQKLTYGWASEAHQPLPSAIVRSGGRLSTDDDANRVYRAPAYYRSSILGVTHFNPNAYLAQKSYDGTKNAYPGMTAIDFNGHYLSENVHVPAYGTYGLGTVTSGLPAGKSAFYPPLLDDDGLTAITNCDETQNLLVYAPSSDANAQTLGVLTGYFVDPVYNDYYDNTEGYRRVAEATSDVRGHLVQSDLMATNDHLLVDKQDFNAPIGYTFDGDHLMWYQRTPANNEYVNRTMGWQGISVPFTAELVTTHQKGEITHFYSGSEDSQNNTKKGHEYWLREFTGITEDSKTVAETKTYFARASFDYPMAAGEDKTVTNKFLWDYYYKNESAHNQKDENADTYLQYKQYYNSSRLYKAYPLLSAAKPYILGLPGKLYYEFDLSGSFVPENTAASIAKLEKQVITLASSTGASIGVSDNEMAGVEKTESGTKGYTVTFKPSYMNRNLEAGTNSYTLYPEYDTDGDGTTDCSIYKKVPDTGAATNVSAFRPYFAASVTGGSRRMAPKYIIFSGDNGEEFEESPESVLDGSIEIFVRGRSIVARSHREEATTIRIVNVAGITLNDFVLESGQTVVTPIKIPGVYMANKKKLFVK